jgi:ATP-dependent exoDNAse (exonuclease V) beta subunit
MAYDKAKIYEQAIKAIQENELVFVDEIASYIPCSRSTFYTLFPAESDELDNIKGIIEDVKIKRKAQIRKQLGKSEKAAELLALYRLLATPEEHRKLNQQYLEHSGETQHEFTVTVVNAPKPPDAH